MERDVTPLLQKYCYDCHGEGMSKGSVALDEFKSLPDVLEARKTWESVLRVITRHEMPADDAAAFPTAAEREVIAQFVERELFKLDPANPDPGHVTLRRMNRAEYGNAIRDLVGVDFNAAADFPPDDSGYGFDNIGDVLSLPPVLMEKYLNAAEKILDQAIVTDPIQSRVQRFPASLARIGFNAIGDRGDGWVHLISLEEDDVAVELPITAAGDYIVRFHAFATKTGGALVGQGSDKPIEFNEDPGPTKIALALNDAFVRDFVVTTDAANPGVYETRVGVAAGRQSFRAVMRRKRGGENELTMLNERGGETMFAGRKCRAELIQLRLRHEQHRREHALAWQRLREPLRRSGKHESESARAPPDHPASRGCRSLDAGAHAADAGAVGGHFCTSRWIEVDGDLRAPSGTVRRPERARRSRSTFGHGRARNHRCFRPPCVAASSEFE